MSPAVSDALMGLALLLIVIAGLLFLFGGILFLVDWWEQREQHREYMDECLRLRDPSDAPKCAVCGRPVGRDDDAAIVLTPCGSIHVEHRDCRRRRATTAVIEAKPASGSWGRA